MIVRHIIFFVLVGLLGGCAFTPQAVILRPSVDIERSAVGAGKTLKLSVIDERPKTTLGTRGVGGVGEELTISGDLVTIVSDAIKKGLEAKDFDLPKDIIGNDRELRVELRALEYRVLMGFWAGTLKTESTMKGICMFGDSRPYEKLYRGEHQESVQIVQGEEANNKYVNIALSASINQLLSDKELLRCLSK